MLRAAVAGDAPRAAAAAAAGAAPVKALPMVPVENEVCGPDCVQSESIGARSLSFLSESN